MKFKDHFSQQASQYSQYRPLYPQSVYDYLQGLCEGHSLAWDCACGSGQASAGLSQYFERVVATDASETQIRNASGAANVAFKVAPAESSPFENDSVDLVVVAQALHWFQIEKFFEEAKRVMKPKGLIAVWTYAITEIDDETDRVVSAFYEGVIGSYWPPERAMVENAYSEIDFPFSAINQNKAHADKKFDMEVNWSLEQFIGYLQTWSAVQKFKDVNEKDPLVDFIPKLESVWLKDEVKRVRWPLKVIVGRNN